MTAVVPAIDLRPRFGNVRDQFDRPTCLVFATSDAHFASFPVAAEFLSCEFLFYQSKLMDKSHPTTGVSVSTIQHALEQKGQPKESDWPYLLQLPADLSTWKPPSSIGEIHKTQSLYLNNDFHEIWHAIESGIPIVIVMTISDAFFIPNSAIVDAAEPIQAVRHAVLGVGTGRKGAQKLILVRNSWGADWGDDGHAWLSDGYLAKRLICGLRMK